MNTFCINTYKLHTNDQNSANTDLCLNREVRREEAHPL